MSAPWKLFRNLKKKLFGKTPPKPDAIPKTPSAPPKTTPQITDSSPSLQERKDPYFIQIGFDFGTSYSKCICRDVMTNKAWVYIDPQSQEQELPFLIPSALAMGNNKIFHIQDSNIHYPENGLYHLKTALVLAANRQLSNPSLVAYRNAIKQNDANRLSEFVAGCGVYFLAGVLGQVRDQIRERFPGFGSLPKDYMAINLAIPVEDAQHPEINKLYSRIISDAWEFADQLSGHPPVSLADLQSLRRKNITTNGPCFIYPEVSANVQGFVRSRASSPGIYLLSDTGGSTVDQSVFIFMRQNNEEHLTYLAGRVLPLGSSRIECRAAEKCGKTDCMFLEDLREKKERGEDVSELREAKYWISKELNLETECTIALSKGKLFRKEQLNSIKVIFGGGGYCKYPYKTAVMKPFSGQLFSEALHPDVIGMPVPSDLELKGHEAKWMRRLNVAYGLSFEKNELVPFTYPSDVSDPKPDEISRPLKPTNHAPTKDEC